MPWEVSKKYRDLHLNDEQRKTVTENIGLIGAFLHKYHLDYEEWWDVAAIGFCRAVASYDPSVSMLSTWAYRVMWQEVVTNRRKEQRRLAKGDYPTIVSFDREVESTDGDTVNLYNMVDSGQDVSGEAVAKETVRNLLETLPPSKKETVCLAMKGLSQRQIAKIKKCSQANVSRQLQELKEVFKEHGMDMQGFQRN